jgi:hypothetical protein
MPVKFKIGFTLDAETLFGIIAKFIPLDNLSVEEVVERPQYATRAISAPERIEKQRAPHTQKHKRAGRAPGTQLNLDEGVNGVIMGTFVDGGQHSYGELKRLVTKAGYAGSGIGSRIGRLVEVGALVRISGGKYVKGKTP